MASTIKSHVDDRTCPSHRRRWMSLLLGFVGLAALFLALLWVFQRRLIYFPFPQRVPPAESYLPGAESVSFTTDDGLLLQGWFLGARGPDTGIGVVVMNGNAGNRSLRAPLAEALATHGLSVLLFDYRGYGGNPGSPSEAGLLRDARAAYLYLAEDRGLAGNVVYFGESLGAAVAVGLAREHPPAALVLRSPFTSLADVGRFHYPFLPVSLLLRDRYPSLARIRHLTCPVLVLAGERDRIVPPRQSRALFEAAPGPKRLILLPDADHNDLELLAGRRLVLAVLAFLDDNGVLKTKR